MLHRYCLIFSFFDFSRAHTDENECLWNFGFTYSREEQEQPEDYPQTRNNPFNIRAHGLDYVDFETKTIVRAATNSMTGYQPKFMHATTNGHRVKQFGASLPVSKHIVKALKEMTTKQKKGEWEPLVRISTGPEDSGSHLEKPYYVS
jgi:hypothetical protein